MVGKRIALIVISSYRYVLRPLLGGGGSCRYVPSCSEYAVDAIGEFGIVRGSGMTLRRFISCRPRGGMGWDPVRHGRKHSDGRVHAGGPLP